MLQKFKKIDALKGSPFKTLTKSELENKHVSSFRRAVYPIRNIKKGSVMSFDVDPAVTHRFDQLSQGRIV